MKSSFQLQVYFPAHLIPPPIGNLKERPQEQLQSWGHFLCKRPMSTHSTLTPLIAVHMIALGLPLKRNQRLMQFIGHLQARMEKLHVYLGLGTEDLLWCSPQAQWHWQERWQQLTYQLQLNLFTSFNRLCGTLTGCKALCLVPRGKIYKQTSNIYLIEYNVSYKFSNSYIKIWKNNMWK